VLGEAKARALLARLWALETEKSMDFDAAGPTAVRAAS
jgi:hypothetical protein